MPPSPFVGSFCFLCRRREGMAIFLDGQVIYIIVILLHIADRS
ncbi:hypothetical protein TGS27_2269 [Geobacillus stearothermophilus]|uniref:Uncharacterized protein n=1 Tax=Geobacillus stearothermophilus TaxID=1422 RepID=A0ABQ7HGL2_GEOSE|nr:hypothetical protein GS8_925 [Geobacillus stearothermophilus]OAO78995.1 hypothetical protein TGS27_2269 [Geobacillus stearothermophilus]